MKVIFKVNFVFYYDIDIEALSVCIRQYRCLIEKKSYYMMVSKQFLTFQFLLISNIVDKGSCKCIKAHLYCDKCK